ncbi:MAG TPA: hypothetical protein VFU73_14610 [Actinocrinis sp.]|nr:hypothetical protein [Actinocrinis sp.]
MSVLRQRLAVSAVLATSLTVVAGCASVNKPGGPSGAGSATAVAKSSTAYTPGTLLVSDGSSTVVIGGAKVTFPTTVTDAAWSPDGSRIAFVAADGSIDTARPDGSGLLTLTHGSAKRSHPSWTGAQIVFSEQGADGVAKLQEVSSNGHPEIWWRTGEQPLGWASPDESERAGNTVPDGNDTPQSDGVPESVAFQHQGSHGPEVWIFDDLQREPEAAKLAQGSQPALSPDGTQVAYVGTDGQIREVSAAPAFSASGSPSPAAATVISSGVSGATDLVWSPDSTKIAFSTPSGIETVAVHPSGGPSAPTKLTSSPGVPSYLIGRADHIDRISAADPVAESVAASQARWPTVQNFAMSQSSQIAMSATLAGSANAQAAFAGAGAAGAAGPLLFTGSGTLDPRVASELKRVFGTVGDNGAPTVTILGGTDQVSAQAESALQQLGYQTTRISGDRYAINAGELAPGASGSQFVAVVSDNDPAAAAAVGVTSQVVLTKGATLPAAARAYLAKLESGSTIYAVGAEARDALAAWTAKPAGVTVQPLVGADDAETTVLVAQTLDGARAGVVLATANNPADLAEAMATASGFKYALLAVDPSKGLEPTTLRWLTDSDAAVGTTVLVGDQNTLTAAFAQKVGTAVSGPVGWTPSSLMYPN